MTTSFVSSGNTVSNTTVGSGDSLGVYGATVGTVVSSGGFELVLSGGVASATTVSSGATEVISSGGVEIGGTLASGADLHSAVQFVLSGGVASNVTVLTYGREYVSSGGSAVGTVLTGAGIQNTTAQAQQFVSAGGSTTGSTLNYNGLESVIGTGATATGTVVNSGGALSVQSGGLVVSTTVNSGGVLQVNQETGADPVGVASGATINSGGKITVSNGSGHDITVNGGSIVEGPGTVVGLVISNHGTGNFTSGLAVSVTLAGAGTSATISRGAVVSNVHLTISASANLNASGIVSGATMDSGGTLVVNGGTEIGAVVNSGGVEALLNGAISGTVINSGGVLRILSGSTTDTTLREGGKIDLRNVVYVSGGHVDLDTVTNVLTITEGATTYTIQLVGDYTGEFFHLAEDGGGFGGTMVTEDKVACFQRGTLIRTPAGEVPVEDLRIGDLIAIAGGEALPLKWIGRRSYRDWLAVGNDDVQPILFKAGSLADRVPARDLYVSPEHAMALDGMLVPARHLVNGVSILKMAGMEAVDYFHLEFDRHVVIFAEGAMAESFVDDDSRLLFHNAAEYHRLYPDEPLRKQTEFCAPRVESGYAFETLRRGLAARGDIAQRGLDQNSPSNSNSSSTSFIAASIHSTIGSQDRIRSL